MPHLTINDSRVVGHNIEILPRALYSIEDLTALMNVHHQTIRRWIREGRLPAKKFGNKYFTTGQAILDSFGDLEGW